MIIFMILHTPVAMTWGLNAHEHSDYIHLLQADVNGV